MLTNMKHTFGNIHHFTTIEAFLVAVKQRTLNSLADFHITTFSELADHAPMEMPPYSKDFYQINFVTQALGSKVKINSSEKQLLNHTLYFISPDHIYSWKRADYIQGYLLYFKKDFLNFSKLNIEDAFYDLFDLKRENLLHLDEVTAEEISSDFEKLYNDYHRKEAFKVQIVQAFLLSMLYRFKSIYTKTAMAARSTSPVNEKFIQFRNLVKNRFMVERSVKYYAEQLFITPNYLNALSQKEKQKSAKQIILEFIVEEAKNLLLYSEKSIAEIAFHLGYEEPTHFTRFFKQNTSLTPKAFRLNKR